MPHHSPTRILLRDLKTGRFYQRPGAWVSSATDATHFEELEHAVNERKLLPNPNMDVLVLDENGRAHFGIRLWPDDQYFPLTQSPPLTNQSDATPS